MLKLIYPVIGNEKCLPIYLTGIGFSSPEAYVRRDEGLVSHQFLYTKSGNGTLVVGGESYPQKAGSCFYLPPEIPHEYCPDDNGNWETCWVVFRGEFITPIMKELGFFEPQIRHFQSLEPLSKVFTLIFQAARNSYNSGYRCSQLLYEFILEARRLFFEDFPQTPTDNIIERTVSFIDENLSADITLDQLSQEANISPQHFCRVFKSHMGMRPMEYIAQKRISFAKSLLENTDKTVTEIGTLAGYSNLSYFGAVFKKYEGISPNEYKKFKYLIKI